MTKYKTFCENVFGSYAMDVRASEMRVLFSVRNNSPGKKNGSSRVDWEGLMDKLSPGAQPWVLLKDLPNTDSHGGAE